MSQLQIYDERNNEQKQMLAVVTGLGKLTNIETQIAESNTGLRISEVPRDELLKKVSIQTKFICRDLGIKTWNNDDVLRYDANSFYNLLVAYYQNLTLKDVKLAFTLLSVGGLDEFIEKDANGKPRKEHFQGFSVDFITRVLNAYQEKRGKVWGKVRKSLPVHEKTTTEAEKEYYRQENLKLIYQAFDDYKSHKKHPDFVFNFIGKIFENAGLIAMREPDQNELKNEFNAQLKTAYTRIEKHTLRNEGFNAISVKSQASRNQMNTKIKDCFDDLIAEGTHLNQVLK